MISPETRPEALPEAGPPGPQGRGRPAVAVLLRLAVYGAAVLLFTKLLNGFPGAEAAGYELFALQTYCFTLGFFLALALACNSLRAAYLVTLACSALLFIANLGVFEAYGRGLFSSDVLYTLSSLDNVGFLSDYSEQLLFDNPSPAVLRAAGLTVAFLALALLDRPLRRRLAVPGSAGALPLPLRWRLPGAVLIAAFALPAWFIWVKSHLVDWVMVNDIETGWHNAGPLVGFTGTLHWKLKVTGRDGDAGQRAAALLGDEPPGAAAAMTTPDIVVWLNESTFDPQDLAALYPQLRNPAVRARFDRVTCCRKDADDWRGRLGVDVVVGGTWVSEFEVISGMRTAWFGPAAYYSHYVLSPIVDRTLFKALDDEGYDSSVIYPVAGDFFFARQAYGFYGAKRFLDPEDMGLGGGDRLRLPDDSFLPPLFDILAAGTAPQFVVVLTNYNHGPHGAAADDAETKAMAEELAVPADVADYLARLAHTNATLTALEAKVEAAPRPTILVHFGDHKPLLGDLDRLDRYSTYLSIVSNRPLAAVPWLAEADRIDLIFVPGILCRLSGCRDPFLRLNYKAAAHCKGDARSCKDETFLAFQEIARTNFHRP